MSNFIDATEYCYAVHDFPVLEIARDEYLDNLGCLLGCSRRREENDEIFRNRLSVAFAFGG